MKRASAASEDQILDILLWLSSVKGGNPVFDLLRTTTIIVKECGGSVECMKCMNELEPTIS